MFDVLGRVGPCLSVHRQLGKRAVEVEGGKEPISSRVENFMTGYAA